MRGGKGGEGVRNLLAVVMTATWWMIDCVLQLLLCGSRGSSGKNVIFSNGPNSTSECFNLLY